MSWAISFFHRDRAKEPRLQGYSSTGLGKPQEAGTLFWKETNLSCVVKCCEVGGGCSHIYVDAKLRDQELDGLILPSDCCLVDGLGPQGVLSRNASLEVGRDMNKSKEQRYLGPWTSDILAKLCGLHTFSWADDTYVAFVRFSKDALTKKMVKIQHCRLKCQTNRITGESLLLLLL